MNIIDGIREKFKIKKENINIKRNVKNKKEIKIFYN